MDTGVPERELERLRAENARLRAENAHLCAELQQRETERSAPRAARATPVQLRLPLDEPPPVPVTKSSRLAERIALFRTLFRGRTDVYARRWEVWLTGLFVLDWRGGIASISGATGGNGRPWLASLCGRHRRVSRQDALARRAQATDARLSPARAAQAARRPPSPA